LDNGISFCRSKKNVADMNTGSNRQKGVLFFAQYGSDYAGFANLRFSIGNWQY
jgi:hypothetical protein